MVIGLLQIISDKKIVNNIIKIYNNPLQTKSKNLSDVNKYLIGRTSFDERELVLYFLNDY